VECLVVRLISLSSGVWFLFEGVGIFCIVRCMSTSAGMLNFGFVLLHLCFWCCFYMLCVLYRPNSYFGFLYFFFSVASLMC
jgi:hypothetical protein